MAEVDRQRELARAQDVVDRLGRDGAVTGYRLAACGDLSDADLRALAGRSGGDKRLRDAAYNALRLRKRRTPDAVPGTGIGQSRDGNAREQPPRESRQTASDDTSKGPTPASGVPEAGDGATSIDESACIALRPDGAILHRLDEDHVLVLGNTELGDQFGVRLRDLSPAMASRATDALGGLVAASAAGMHVATAVQAIREAGAVFVVTDATRHLLAEPLAMTADGALGWVRPGGRGIAHLRFTNASTTLRTLSSITGLAFTLSVVAGQARMDRTLSQICLVLDELKQMARDQQLTEISVAGQLVADVLVAAEQCGELTDGLVAMLPSQQQLMENADRAAREVARLQRRLDRLPAKASEKLKVLESTVPDMLLSLGLYGEAERTLSAAEALYRHDLFQRGDRAAEAVSQIEAERRRARVEAGTRLARDLDRAMRAVEAEPGGGWFSSGKRKQLRALARQVRSDLPTLRGRAPAAPGGATVPALP